MIPIFFRLTKEVSGYKERLIMEFSGKREIGHIDSSLLKDGDYVIFDASTTVHLAAQCLEVIDNAESLA